MIGPAGNVVALVHSGTAHDQARAGALANTLFIALRSNSTLAVAEDQIVAVVARGACRQPEAVVQIAITEDGTLVGHAFSDAKTGVAFAVIVLSGWKAPQGDNAKVVADYRRAVLRDLLFSPVHAAADEEVYAEAPNGAAAIQLLARMISRLNLRVALPEEGDEVCSWIDVRVIAAYWDPASLNASGDDQRPPSGREHP